MKLLGNERVNVGDNVSAVLQKKILPKCKDQGIFSISCKKYNVGINKAMCDLGAFINVMPLSIYKLLNSGPLKETGVSCVSGRSVGKHPRHVNEQIFPTNFYIIDMKDDNSINSFDILLGRPFLSSAQMKIDVQSRTLTMEFDSEVVRFNVYEDIGHPCEIKMSPVSMKLNH
ncbi:retropepsin-like protein [Gossypium australe]|uniref:Retropepsin-like protein n=1 Tax=Gossypium australe TaxID=47621 RepID=A0A5B6VNF9_9ROSI|nr:retropepsin-like protein [Gossypium australe]